MSASRAASASPSGVCSAVYSASGSVRVSPGMLEANVITAPNSPRPAANAVTAPARMPGAISGSVIEKKRSSAPGAERARGVFESAIDVLERDADRAHHQRKRHDRRRQRGAGAGERQLDAEILVQPAADAVRACRTTPAVDSRRPPAAAPAAGARRRRTGCGRRSACASAARPPAMANGRLNATLRAATDRLSNRASDSAGDSIGAV